MVDTAIEGFMEHLDFPADDAEVATLSDTVNLAKISRALYIGATGDISVEMAKSGTAIVFVGVQAGSILPIRVSRVNLTGTTASSIVALS